MTIKELETPALEGEPDKEYEKDLGKLKEEILKEGGTLVFKRDLLNRFIKIDEEYKHRPWSLLQILANINILIGEKPCEDCVSRQYLLDNCVVDKVTMPYVPVSKIKNAPPVISQPRTGHWTNGDSICPCCGEDKFKDLDADIWADWQPKYCPNCGSKMVPKDSTCDSCNHRDEVDGSNCYECVKGIHNNYKADSEKE